MLSDGCNDALYHRGIIGGEEFSILKMYLETTINPPLVKVEKDKKSRPSKGYWRRKVKTLKPQQPKFEGQCDDLKGFTLDCFGGSHIDE